MHIYKLHKYIYIYLGFDISVGKIRLIDRAIQFADKFPDI
jgi:hypothetical protein